MRYALMHTPLGVLTVASTAKGLASVRFGNGVPPDGIVDAQTNHVFIQQLGQYFQGNRTRFEMPLDFDGTLFQVAVWLELLKIPYGHTRTYGDLAKTLGKPGAARAVGMANHQNPIPVVIPCHRVVGQNGSLTGYAGGIQLKQQLLSIEQGPTLFS